MLSPGTLFPNTPDVNCNFVRFVALGACALLSASIRCFVITGGALGEDTCEYLLGISAALNSEGNGFFARYQMLGLSG